MNNRLDILVTGAAGLVLNKKKLSKQQNKQHLQHQQANNIAAG